ncbi:MAG: PilZ domain-containing protein [Proteobacteria bacterium]|nr:PilZ domain-containing protein [Pseudomonadota bacterium]
MSSTNDHRYTRRHLLKQEVMLSTESKYQLCKVHDISITGALLSVAWFGLTKDTPVTLTINLAIGDEKANSQTLPAKVARVSREGTAITFDELPTANYSALLKFVNTLELDTPQV